MVLASASSVLTCARAASSSVSEQEYQLKDLYLLIAFLISRTEASSVAVLFSVVFSEFFSR